MTQASKDKTVALKVEHATALGQLALREVIKSRISRVANNSGLTDRHRALMTVTLEDVRAASAFDENLECLAEIVLKVMPTLKDQVDGIYENEINNQIKWSKPKQVKPRAEL